MPKSKKADTADANVRAAQKITYTPLAGTAVRNARIGAIKEAGGPGKVLEVMDYSRAYLDSIRRGSKIDPIVARQLHVLSGGKYTLKQLAPDVFGGLTVKELGYEPKSE